jgi:hypothetical protein
VCVQLFQNHSTTTIMSTASDAPKPNGKKMSKQTKLTIGGIMGGACEALCLHPTDTVKTRLRKICREGFAL